MYMYVHTYIHPSLKKKVVSVFKNKLILSYIMLTSLITRIILIE